MIRLNSLKNPEIIKFHGSHDHHLFYNEQLKICFIDFTIEFIKVDSIIHSPSEFFVIPSGLRPKQTVTFPWYGHAWSGFWQISSNGILNIQYNKQNIQNYIGNTMYFSGFWNI